MLCPPVSWDVPLSPRGRSPQTRPNATLAERLSRAKAGQSSRLRSIRAAEERRLQQLEEKRRKSRWVYEHAKAVAALHASTLQERTNRLEHELYEKQERARYRRVQARTARPVRDKVSTAPNKTCFAEVSQCKLLLACMRACQRLVCVIARSKLHNARAKLLSSRVKAARLLQHLWRQVLRMKSIERERDAVLFALEGIPCNPSFEQTATFIQSPKALLGASFLAGENNKILLAGHLVLWNSEEALSMPDRSVAILQFAFKRLCKQAKALTQTSIISNPRLMLVNTGHSALDTLSAFDENLRAYCALFNEAKRVDVEHLAEESFDTLVQLRILFEESIAGSEEKALFERGFYRVVAKLKRLFSSVNALDAYKRMLGRCAKAVKVHRERLHADEGLILESSFTPHPTTLAAPSFGPEIMSEREWASYITNVVSQLISDCNDLTPHRADLHMELNQELSIFKTQAISVFNNHGKQLDTKRYTSLRSMLISVLDAIVKRVLGLSEEYNIPAIKQRIAKHSSEIQSAKGESDWRRAVIDTFSSLHSETQGIAREIEMFRISQIQTALSSGDFALVRHLTDGIRRRYGQSQYLAWCETVNPNSIAGDAPSFFDGSSTSSQLLPSVLVSGQAVQQSSLFPSNFISLEPFADDNRFVHAYRLLGDILPRVATGEVRNSPEDHLSIHSRRTLTLVRETVDLILCEAHNHMIFKQTLASSFASLSRVLESTRCGTTVRSVLSTAESVLACHGRKLPPETAQLLSRIIDNQESSSLRRILARRLAGVLTKVVLQPSAVDTILSERVLKGFGLTLFRADIRQAAEQLQRLIVLLAIQG